MASIESLSEIQYKSIQAQFINESGEATLAFTSDLMSMFTLNCENKEDCLHKLISRTLEKAGNNLFSKNNGVFGQFSIEDEAFIKNVISTSNNT